MSVQLYNPTTDELTQVAGEEFNDTVIRVSALPSASADLINETYLLVADQTGYARGGIYQCQYVDDAFTWVLVNGSGMTVDAVEDGNMNGVTSNAVADKFATLGTASEKDFTNFVSPTDSGVPISSSVYSAITSALYGAYHPSGSKTIAELDSSLLIQANVGNVYKITDSGVTTNLFIGGAGQTINVGDNAVVVYDSDGETFKYALQSGVIDLSEYQTKELPSGALIEDVIPTIASSSDRLVVTSGLNNRVREVFRIPYNMIITDFLARFTNIGIHVGEVFIDGNIGDTVVNSWCSYEANIVSITNEYVGNIKITNLSNGAEFLYKSYNTGSFNWVLVTNSALVSATGTYVGTLNPNQTATITLTGTYGGFYGMIQVSGSGCIDFKIRNANYIAASAVDVTESVTINGNDYRVGVLYPIYGSNYYDLRNAIRFKCTANEVITIQNIGNESEKIWLGGAIESVTIS